jgi:hypothetical protein
MRRLAPAAAAATFAVAILLGAVVVPAASAQSTDAATVARDFLAAENTHNVSAAVAFFAPGAIVSLPTGALTTPAEILAWQRDLAAGNFHAETTTPVAVTPEVATFTGTVALDLFRGLGISSLASTWQLTVQLGKVTTFVFDFTPAATVRLGAALAAAGGGGGAAAAATPPGGSGSSAGSGVTAGAAPATPARATSGTLALTGAPVGPLSGVGALAVLFGGLLLAATRRRPASATGRRLPPT